MIIVGRREFDTERRSRSNIVFEIQNYPKQIKYQYKYMNHNNSDSLTDIDYINHMIPHHQIAIDMSEPILLQSKQPEIMSLCRNIIRDQKYEIWEMNIMRDLVDNSSTKITPKKSHQNNNKTMTEKQYLEHMIPHHQVAIDMSIKLLLYTDNNYMIQLAHKIILQQKKEIMIMTSLLDTLDKNKFLFHSKLL